MRLIDADALQKAIDSLPISPLTQEVFKGHVDAAIANAPTVAKDTNIPTNGRYDFSEALRRFEHALREVPDRLWIE